MTRPTAPGEGETSWSVEVSLDLATWYQLPDTIGASLIAIASTQYDDSAATTSYSANTISDVLGSHATFPSVKSLITDGNRLIGAGAWEANTKGSRVYHTPVLGSTTTGDDERLSDLVTSKPYTDLNEKDGGDVIAVGGPISRGTIVAFKYRQIWIGTPTGDVDVPYLWRNLSRTVGAINHKSIILAEDASGRPALYFLSYQGAYRIGAQGLQYVGRDIEDIWYGFNTFTTGVNLEATTAVSHGLYHVDKGRLEWYLATGSNNVPNIRVVLHVKQATRTDQYGLRGGWTYHSLPTAVNCSTLFSDVVAASMSRKLKPYNDQGTNVIVKIDDDSALSDNGTDFQAYIKTRSIVEADQLGKNYGIRESVLIAEPLTGVTITQTIIRDYGLESQVSTVSLTADATEQFVIRKFEGSFQSDMGVVQLQLGDAAAAQGQWSLSALLVPVGEERTK